MHIRYNGVLRLVRIHRDRQHGLGLLEHPLRGRPGGGAADAVRRHRGRLPHAASRETPHYVSASSLYHDARKALDNNDYEYAIKQYEALTSRFPFTDEARQARLDLIYVYYRKGEKESATDAAEQFLRENPDPPARSTTPGT